VLEIYINIQGIYIYRYISFCVFLPGRRFQGTTEVHQMPRKPRHYAGHLTLSPGDPIPGSLCCVSAKPHCRQQGLPRREPDAAKQLAIPLRETVKQEREPSLGPPSLSPGSFALPLSFIH